MIILELLNMNFKLKSVPARPGLGQGLKLSIDRLGDYKLNLRATGTLSTVWQANSVAID